MAGQIGSVGSLVGSSLETAGHYLQSEMLDFFVTPYGRAMLYFLFFTSAVSGLFILTVTGKYKQGMSLIVGPALFFLMTENRVESRGAFWQFGSRTYPNDYVIRALEDVPGGPRGGTVPETPPGNSQPPVIGRVSLFFSVWNRVTSGVVQSMIAALQLTEQRSNMTLVSKVDRYRDLLNLAPRDTKLKSFMNMVVLNECSTYFLLLKEYVDPQTNDERRRIIRPRIEAEGSQKTVSVDGVAGALASLQALELEARARAIAGVGADAPLVMSCKDLWLLITEAYKVHFEILIDELADMDRGPGLTKEAVKAQLAERFDARTMNGDIQQVVVSGENVIRMINEVAARSILHDLKSMAIVPPTVDPAKVALRNSEQAGKLMGTAEHSIRMIQTRDQDEWKGNFLMSMLSMPNIQGMLLYFFAMSFPFFALTLLIPGHQNGFLTWMGLWLWVKLWDFGFAIVMIIDNMLYYLLPHGPPITDQVLEDPGQTLKALLEVDPAYSINTYYNLIATCIAAVPIITGILVKKGGGQIVDMLDGAFTTFSGNIGATTAGYTRSLQADTYNRRFSENIMAAADKAIAGAMKDPEVTSAFMHKVLAESAATAAAGTKFGLAQYPLQAEAKRRGAVFESLVKERVANAMYNEIYSQHNRDLVQDAIRMEYFSRDFMSMYPGAERLESAKARSTLMLADQVDGAWNTVLNSVGGWSGGNDILTGMNMLSIMRGATTPLPSERTPDPQVPPQGPAPQPPKPGGR